MRFMIIRKADSQTEAGAMPTEELMAAMGKYIEEMAAAGVLRAGEGLQQSAKGARVKFHAGKPTVIDGPFTETKELVAGISIIDVKSKAEAIAWAKKWPTVDGHGEVELEVRQIWEGDDSGDDQITAEARERELRFREHIRAHGRPLTAK